MNKNTDPFWFKQFNLTIDERIRENIAVSWFEHTESICLMLNLLFKKFHLLYVP